MTIQILQKNTYAFYFSNMLWIGKLSSYRNDFAFLMELIISLCVAYFEHQLHNYTTGQVWVPWPVGCYTASTVVTSAHTCSKAIRQGLFPPFLNYKLVSIYLKCLTTIVENVHKPHITVFNRTHCCQQWTLWYSFKNSHKPHITVFINRTHLFLHYDTVWRIFTDFTSLCSTKPIVANNAHMSLLTT